MSHTEAGKLGDVTIRKARVGCFGFVGVLWEKLMATLFGRQHVAPAADFSSALVNARATLAFGLAADLGHERPAVRQRAHDAVARLLTQLEPVLAACRRPGLGRGSVLVTHKDALADLHRHLRALLFDSGHLLHRDELLALEGALRGWAPAISNACAAAIELQQVAALCRLDIDKGESTSVHGRTLALIAVAQAQKLVQSAGDRDAQNRAAKELVEGVLRHGGTRSLQSIPVVDWSTQHP
ncbi:hypothetical protein L602_000500001240 [Cupriavidus gilardii J11]|uniref:Uncharacterized protein n=1 Tax=Cupriavidus gilardii J11 TaxID=936133 RepID=A0A562B620_9BURK|nr:hypothetical protein [Cupriavidus gilardii]TWG80478.1 hypothetical protein L602_000500001240 [Cupriavidus gilardii J11]